MARKNLKKITKVKKTYSGPDLMDVNARALIAFALMVIAFVLVYVVFFK